MKIAKGLFVGAFLLTVTTDGEVIIPDRCDVDPLNAGVYVRQPANLLNLHAVTSTGDSIFSFDTADIIDV